MTRCVFRRVGARLAASWWSSLAALLLCVSAAGVLPAAEAAPAAPVRIASAFDPQTMDPHALALLYHSRIAYQVYDALVSR
ncbi:MAG: hypothetical protein ABI696_14380, partial [Rubrivivax sp.]